MLAGDANAKKVKIMYKGNDYIFLRCSQVKSEVECVLPSALSNKSDMLAIIPCPGDQGEMIYYEARHVGSKLALNNSSIDNIELSFVDKWGQPLFGIRDFIVELTADFVKLGPLQQQPTGQNIRDMYMMI